MTTKFFISIFILLIILFGLAGNFALADCSGQTGGDGETCIPNPIGESDISIIIGKIIQAVLGIVGSLALLMFIYGGFVWMTAAGSSEKVQKGRDIIIWAIIGLVVIFSAYAMVHFVITGIAGK